MTADIEFEPCDVVLTPRGWATVNRIARWGVYVAYHDTQRSGWERSEGLVRLDRSGVVPLSPMVVVAANALSAVIDRDGRATVRTVAAELGRSVSTAHTHLEHLRSLGICGWADGGAGTIHLTVGRVDVKAAS